MSNGKTIIRFDEISYSYTQNRRIFDEVSFSIKKGAKLTLMGQNGAGKTTLFNLILGNIKPDEGDIHSDDKMSVAIATQVIPREKLTMTVREYFQSMFTETIYAIDPKIDKVLVAVALEADKEKIMNEFSGGQQARLLLAGALIQDADILLLDEPTNNLDKAGIRRLTNFLVEYDKTVIVISHDADFLNSFTEGVLYLNVQTQKVETYVGDYFAVSKEIMARVAREQRLNAQLKKQIIAKKEKSNFFANKGGRLRAVAKQMREDAASAEESMVDVRKDDKVIGKFIIPFQDGIVGKIVDFSSVSRLKDGKPKAKPFEMELRKGDRLLIEGPNGVGKTTLLETIVNKDAKGVDLMSGIRIGYYRQDFSNMDFNASVYQILTDAMVRVDPQELRKVAGGFLIGKDEINSRLCELSEGQKGLVAFARLVLMRPALLILDEPTNHINFRHLPVIAKAIKNFEGPVIAISHMHEFVKDLGFDKNLDLGK